jgi:hypothetical protein
VITARNFNRFWGEGEKKDWDNLSDEKKKEHLISLSSIQIKPS